MKGIAAKLDLALDDKKTFFWSTCALTRKELREAGHQVALQIRDIGGHMQYCRRKTNSTLTQRLTALGPLWSQLARSPAPVSQKEAALVTVAWPRAFQGIATVHLGATWYRQLRSGAMKGLGHAHAGANPEVQLSLVQDSRTDPEYFALNLTVRTFRKHCVPDSAFPILDMLSAQPPLHLAPGPAGVLLTRLQTIGWQWDGGGWLLDQEMLPIHLLNAPVQELGSRMQRAWQKEVGCRLAKRKTFKGMSKCCVRTSRQGWGRLTPLQKSLMRVVHNGSFYTQDKHAKTGFAETPACRWCGEEDSVLHRVWQCPATEHLHAEIPMELRKEIEKEPECIQHHAWFCEPEQAALFRKALQGIRPYQTVQWVSPDLPDTLHLFTDGSCQAPGDSRTRIASWALVLALPAQDNFWPLAYGLVPGQHQTGGRGELIAAIQAFRCAEEHQKSFCLWTDYDRVVRLLETWEWQDVVPTAWKHDHDLQQELFVRYKRARRKGRFSQGGPRDFPSEPLQPHHVRRAVGPTGKCCSGPLGYTGLQRNARESQVDPKCCERCFREVGLDARALSGPSSQNSNFCNRDAGQAG